MPSPPTPIRHRLAANMRRLRQERKWSQEMLAAKAGIHHNQIGTIERSETNTGVDLLEKLAAALDVPASRLLD